MDFDNLKIVLGNEFSIALCILLVFWVPLYAWYQLSKWGNLISTRLKKTLIFLRVLIAAVLFLILLNIKFIFQEPDESALSFAMLIDNSGSMNVNDIDGKSRLHFCNDNILGADGVLEKIRKKYHTIPFVFSDHVVADPEIKVVAATSKQTDIDKSLLHILDRIPSQSLGGVLLVTDGNDNIEEGLIRAGIRFQDMGIPISVIGVGSKEKKGDLVLTIKNSPKKLERGEEGEIIVKLSRSRMNFSESVLKFQMADEPVKEQKVVWADDETEKEIKFKVSSYRSGKLACHAQVQIFPDELDKTNNEQFVSVEITEPKIWKILYLGSALNWDYTFLNRQFQGADQFLIHSVVKKDDKSFHITGLDNELKSFPEFSVLKDYQALVIDVNSIPLMAENHIKDIKEYLDRVGGSLLFIGPYVNTKPLDTIIQEILPVKLGAVTSFRNKREINFHSTLLFLDKLDEKEESWQKSLFVPPQQFVQKIENYKLGAQKIMEAIADDLGILTTHHYGSGKVAFLGMDSTWKWNMDSDYGSKFYLRFWNYLFQWLTATAKEALVVVPNLEKVEMNQQIQINAFLLDERFMATDDASVTIQVLEPGETVFKGYKMNNDPSEKGKYSKELFIGKQGEYRYEVTAILTKKTEDKPMVRTFKGKFQSMEVGAETGESNLKEDLLEDLARLTNGKYWHYSDKFDLNKIPISKNVKMKTRLYQLNDGFFLLILCLTLLLLDVFLRRKNGMK